MDVIGESNVFHSNRKDSHRSLKRLISPFNDEWDSDAISIQSNSTTEEPQMEADPDFIYDQSTVTVPAVQFQINQSHGNSISDVQVKVTGTSWFGAIFLIVNACLGAGLLNFPQAYDLAGGILVAVIIQALLMVFIFSALVILAFCSDFNRAATYQDVVLSMCGKRVHQFCAFVIFLYCYGTCLTFLVIIGDQFDRAFDSIYGSTFCHKWYMNRNFTMVVSSTILILPMCFPRRIDFLKYASSMGVIAIIYVVIAIVYEYCVLDHDTVVIRTGPKVWTDVFYVVPVICFGYQCHVSVIPIYSCLRNRNVPNFMKSVVVALLICISTYTVAGIFGYLTFGTTVDSDILESYQTKGSVVMIGMIALAAKTYTTYPILLFCGRTAIDGLWVDIRKLDSIDVASGERKRRIITVLLWFVSNMTLAVFIPNISDIIQILGSLAALFIFVFPGMCLMQVSWKKDPNSKSLKSKFFIFISGLFIVFGSFIFGLVFVQSILLDASGAGSKRLCQ